MFRVVDIGEIYICDFGQNNGSVQSGVRPCIIVDNKNACAFSPCIHCVPLTTQIKRGLPLHYELSQKDCACLEADSIALCEQYTLLLSIIVQSLLSIQSTHADVPYDQTLHHMLTVFCHGT